MSITVIFSSNTLLPRNGRDVMGIALGTEAVLGGLKQLEVIMAMITKVNEIEKEGIFRNRNLKKYFAFIIERKEGSNPYAAAAKLLSKDRTNKAYAIENTQQGVRAAKKENLCCVAIRSEETEEDLSEADHILDSIKELPPFFIALKKGKTAHP